MKEKEFRIIALFGALLVLFVVSTSVGVEKWKAGQRQVILIPTKSGSSSDIKSTYPMIAYMPISSVENSSRLYNFIEQYIHWTLEESFDDYEKQSVSEQFKMDYVKSKVQNAVYASRGPENIANMKRLIDSSSRYYELKQKNLQWHFNIDAIEKVESGPRSGLIYVSVLGEYQLTYDKKYVSTPNEKVIGYQRIHFMIEQGTPSLDTKDNFTNEYGLYVISMKTETVPYAVQDDLFKRVMSSGYNVDQNPSEKDKDSAVKLMKEQKDDK